MQYGCYLSCGNIASFLDGKEEEIYLDEDHTDLALRASASAEEDSQTVKSEAKYEANKMEVVETEINVKVEESRKASDPTLILATVNVETNPDSEKIESSQPIMKVETKVEATETSALSEVPQPSERLRSYRLVKHQLRENVQPIPQLSTFATLKFIVLLLKEKKVQDRFLAAANKAIQEKVATAVGSSNNVELAQLLNDANFRFCLQIIQICFTSSLELPAFNEKMWEVYLPALVLQHKLLKLEELQCIPSDTMANAYLEKYPLSSQDGIQLDLWKEKLKRWIEDLRRSK